MTKRLGKIYWLKAQYKDLFELDSIDLLNFSKITKPKLVNLSTIELSEEILDNNNLLDCLAIKLGSSCPAPFNVDSFSTSKNILGYLDVVSALKSKSEYYRIYKNYHETFSREQVGPLNNYLSYLFYREQLGLSLNDYIIIPLDYYNIASSESLEIKNASKVENILFYSHTNKRLVITRDNDIFYHSTDESLKYLEYDTDFTSILEKVFKKEDIKILLNGHSNILKSHSVLSTFKYKTKQNKIPLKKIDSIDFVTPKELGTCEIPIFSKNQTHYNKLNTLLSIYDNYRGFTKLSNLNNAIAKQTNLITRLESIVDQLGPKILKQLYHTGLLDKFIVKEKHKSVHIGSKYGHTLHNKTSFSEYLDKSIKATNLVHTKKRNRKNVEFLQLMLGRLIFHVTIMLHNNDFSTSMLTGFKSYNSAKIKKTDFIFESIFDRWTHSVPKLPVKFNYLSFKYLNRNDLTLLFEETNESIDDRPEVKSGSSL